MNVDSENGTDCFALVSVNINIFTFYLFSYLKCSFKSKVVEIQYAVHVKPCNTVLTCAVSGVETVQDLMQRRNF
jgi:hypothetical protein